MMGRRRRKREWKMTHNVRFKNQAFSPVLVLAAVTWVTNREVRGRAGSAAKSQRQKQHIRKNGVDTDQGLKEEAEQIARMKVWIQEVRRFFL